MSAKRRRAGAEALNNLRASKVSAPGAEARPGASAGGALACRLLWAAAICFIICGYAMLSKVDPGGRNIWAIASPSLLLAGYLLFIPAIITTYRRKC